MLRQSTVFLCHEELKRRRRDDESRLSNALKTPFCTAFLTMKALATSPAYYFGLKDRKRLKPLWMWMDFDFGHVSSKRPVSPEPVQAAAAA